jgi:hypothetical protein
VGLSIKGWESCSREKGEKKKKQESLCSGNVAGGGEGIARRQNLKNLNVKKVT